MRVGRQPEGAGADRVAEVAAWPGRTPSKTSGRPAAADRARACRPDGGRVRSGAFAVVVERRLAGGRRSCGRRRRRSPVLPESVLRNCDSSVAKAMPVPLSDVGLNFGSTRRGLDPGRGVDRHVAQRDVVDVVGRHVAARAEARPAASRAGHGELCRCRCRTSEAHWPGTANGLWLALARAVGRRGRVAVAVRGHRARQQQERRAPDRIAPRVRHHRPVPLVEDLAVAVRALAGVVLGLPVLLVGRREGLGLAGEVGRRLRDPVREFGRRVLRPRDERDRAQHRHELRPWRLPAADVLQADHAAAPDAVVTAGRSAASTGSLSGTSGARASLTRNRSTTSAA